MALTEIKQDVGRLADDEFAGLEIGRREWRRWIARIGEAAQHRSHPRTSMARDIIVRSARLLERQAHEFTAARYGWPIVKLVTHHSTRAPVVFTTLPHLTISAATKVRICSGIEVRGSAPSTAMRLL